MALYSDRDSPKKAAAAFGQRWAGRRASVKKTTCVWVLVAVLSLLMLKVVFYDSSSLTVSTPEKREELTTERELPSLDLPSTGHKEKVVHSGSGSSSDVPGSSGRDRPASPKKSSKLSRVDKPPASPEAKSLHVFPRSPPPKAKKLPTPELTSEEEEEEFDLPEDNDKEEAKSWQAPPVKKIEGVEQVTNISNASALAPGGIVGR